MIINEKEKNCYILNNYSNNDTVQFEPAEYWYLDLYIITLDDSDGVLSSSQQKYMVLEYPSYTDIDSGNSINNCIWSVPYMAYLFHKTGTKRYKTVDAITRFYDRQISAHTDLLKELEEYRFYHMGISDYDKIEGKSYIEYKVSSRQPDKWKCYYIKEHYIVKIDSLGILNLVDPEGLHSYRYYPLMPKPNIAGETTYYAGKYFASNVTHLLKTSYNKLIQFSNPVCGNMLRYKLYGILFKIDIVGFTLMYNKIVDEMKSFDETGKEIALHFIAGISNIFENEMQKFDISQYIIEGDGLTGMIPLRDSSEDKIGISRVIDCISGVKQDINLLASKLGETVCIRCSIIAGSYIYGKLTGLSSKGQAVGEIMITLSRMDQYLKELIKNRDNLNCISIVSCIDNQLYNRVRECFINRGFRELTSQTNYRETEINAKVIYKEA